MIRSQNNRMGVDQHYLHTVSFRIVDSKTSTDVTPSNIYLNGEIVEYTKSDNYYIITVPISGMFEIYIIKDGYNDFIDNFSYNTLNNSAINLTKIQVEGEFEAFVYWDHSVDQDFDSWTYIYNSSGSQISSVYYRHKEYSDSDTKIVLDKDDTGGEDGETTTIKPLFEDYSYTFIVKDYTHRSDAGNTGFADRSAQVKVTYNNQTYNYLTPVGTTGRTWTVCRIVNGEYIEVNEFSEEYS